MISVHIELREGESLRDKLAGAFPDLFGRAAPHTVDSTEVVTFGPLRVTTPAEDAEVAGLPPVPNGAVFVPQDNYQRLMAEAQRQPAPPQTLMADTGPVDPPKRGRGRPRKDEQAPPLPAAEDRLPVFTVRRFDGQREGEFHDSGQATAALIDMVRLAGDAEAIKDLWRQNAGEFASWPEERQVEIREAFEAAEASLKAGEPEPIEYPGPHIGLQKQPLDALTLTKADASNAVAALIHAGGTSAANAVRTYFGEIGTPNVTSLKEDDGRIAQIVRWAAPKLGLPIVTDALT